MPDAIAWTPAELADRDRIEREWPALAQRAEDLSVRFQSLWDAPRYRAEADELERLKAACDALEPILGRNA